MGSNFNPVILVEKLAKLNSTQQSIETLSHWCIFHMNKAKLVVETWGRQFHRSPREQRLAFLYLANDILQNSRRKGIDFVTEFWKVLPDSLHDVIENGDEFGRNAVFRMINIWEERKVFGSRGQILKEEFVRRQMENNNTSWKHVEFKQRPPSGNTLDKLVSCYQVVNGFQQEEEAIYSKCRNAIIFVEKVDKDIEVGHAKVSITDELKGHNSILRDCIEQLTNAESSRANLASILRDALQEQEDKLDQIRNQIQAAQRHSEQAGGICRQLLGENSSGHIQPEQAETKNLVAQVSQSFATGGKDQSISTIHGRQVPFTEKTCHIEENTQSAAAAMAAHLSTSETAAQVLSHSFSSLPLGAISNQIEESSSDYPLEKRARIMNDHPYVPQYPQAPPVPGFAHREHLEDSMQVTLRELNSEEPPPPPPPLSAPPPLPPLPPPMQLYQVPQYMHTALPIPNGPYSYNISQQFPEPVPSYSPSGPPSNGVSPIAPPSNAYQSYPTESVFYTQPSSLPMAPSSHQ